MTSGESGSAPAVRARQLTKTFRHQRGWKELLSRAKVDETLAVDHLDLTVYEGETLGVLGPNGAGKTTLVKLLCTLLLPTSGTAEIFGHDNQKDSAWVRRHIGLVANEERSFYWRLTGRTNLHFFAAISQLSSREAHQRIDYLVELLNLKDFIDQRFNEYSTGMKQKLAIARGLLNRPRLLFMDEPTRGLDPIGTHAFLEIIKNVVVKTLGSTVVLCTNSTAEAETLCDRINIINHGRLIYSGTTEEMRSVAGDTDIYRIQVRREQPGPLPVLSGEDGVADSTATSQDGGAAAELRVELARDPGSLSRVLRSLAQSGYDLVSLSKEEHSFDEIVRNLMHIPADAHRERAGTP